jgi:hypothetical protein
MAIHERLEIFNKSYCHIFRGHIVKKQFEKEEKDESACQPGCFPLEWTLWVCWLKRWVCYSLYNIIQTVFVIHY